MTDGLIQLFLHRLTSGDDGTFGVVTDTTDTTGKKVCEMAELPDRDNARGLSRIPAGNYLVGYLAASASGRYRDVYHLKAVPGRSGILIHKGNFVGDKKKGLKTDSWGCLLPCVRVGDLYGQRAGLGSGVALDQLHEVTGRRPFYLEVINGVA